jgi:hypothetical protein
MQVKIHQPAKTTMQSGRAKTKKWVLEYDLTTKRAPEPLIGWVASGDTLNQVKMQFDTVEQAVAHADKMGWTYNIVKPAVRKVKGRTYLDNFKYVPASDKK